jgi:hypothetical protein
VLEFARGRSGELVREIQSTVGRAPRPDPALFALAAACSLGDDDGRRAGLDALPVVARDGAELLIFARYVEASPRRLLRTYREKAGIDARLVVVAMTAKRVSVADFARGWGGPRAAPAAQ